MSKIQTSSPACDLRIRKCIEDYEYFQDGDVIIGGVLSVNQALSEYVEEYGIKHLMMCMRPQPNYYKNLLTFLFTIGVINKEIESLRNFSVGYHIFDSCSDEKKAVKSVLQILSGPGETVPNYSCTEQGKLAGFIGDHYSSSTLAIAQILKIYGYAQISYGATDPILADRHDYPHFFRTVKNDHTNYFTISKLIKYFGWTWVGILASDDDNGEKETQVLTKYLKDDGICVAFVLKMIKSVDYIVKTSKNMIHALKQSTARVITFCGTYSIFVSFTLESIKEGLVDKTHILGPNLASKTFLLRRMPYIFNGSITVEPLSRNIPGLRAFSYNFHPLRFPEDKLLEEIWMLHFYCFSGDPEKKKYFESVMNISLSRCTWKQHISEIHDILSDGGSSHVDHALNAMGSVIFYMYNTQLRKYPIDKIRMSNFKHQIPQYLRQLKMKRNSFEFEFFNEDGEMNLFYMSKNWLAWMENRSLEAPTILTFNPQNVIYEILNIDKNRIIWKNHPKPPKSQCSENCLPGYRKVMESRIYSCCYDCVRCSEGEISNITDSENCIQCSKSEWPNRNQDQCIPKQFEFLSYTQDVIALVLMSLSTFFTLVTALILGIFTYYRYTPIVKANNRNLSFVLLVSIMLSFLCVFLFLGRPVDITCMLRQTAFGVIFSVAVSSVLAKTIMVCIAFRATKPGSDWKKWLDAKLSNSIVVLCSSVQVIINIAWLATSSPFEELDMDSYHSKIVVQCNEGSVVAFYCVLGYMGLLAALSFIIAFLARTLPESFNEAKYITFSMLVFCSVWIAMIPAYLSTKGKYMVAVEIFAILTSSAGLLGCIFLPKCYIILFRPEINTKTYLLGNSNK